MSKKKVKKTGFGGMSEIFGLEDIIPTNENFSESGGIIQEEKGSYPSHIDYASEVYLMQNS